MLQKALFILLIIFILTPFGSPPLALALGLVVALTFGTPYPHLNGKPTRLLLQASVVLLGFGMNLKSIYEAGKDGILLTIVTIFGTLALGYLIGRLLKVRGRISALISAGTAICGGSAIAAAAPGIEAEPEQISISLGTVFVLNAVALFLFPTIGHGLGLSQHQFGIWAAIAIHDTSSVVGAGAAYGAEALATATTIKLARALWIAPVALMLMYLYRRRYPNAKAHIAIPWFILIFLLAVVARTYAPPWIQPSVFDSLVNLAKAGMTVTLFLIGTSLTLESVKTTRWRPLFQGAILWILVSTISLAAVLWLI
ncbi:MAG TPA: putative sulfate exporter family transporter [Pyrinomonadaceae bacterium]|nr:putative sulfate exporter family transporter [Pyrinomonadaceae bacterium]